jgi:pyruvate kinase
MTAAPFSCSTGLPGLWLSSKLISLNHRVQKVYRMSELNRTPRPFFNSRQRQPGISLGILGWPVLSSRPVFEMRKTKIIATLGPATESREMLGKLIQAGVNIFRLNMSHGAHDWVRRVVSDVRSVSTELKTHVAVLMDTQGPAIRTGDLPAALDLHPGQKFTLTVRGETSEELHSVDVNYDNIVNDISIGDTVLVDNGEIEMKVLAKQENKIECEVLTRGTLRSRRHINLPGVKVNLPALTAKDLADIKVGLELRVEYIALSFVREAKDIRQLRAVVEEANYKPQLVAKIEDQEAVKNLNEIIAEADAIMVARGDLGIECPFEELPIIQRRAVKTCVRVGKPVIVATHMLESMIDNPVPTRAEITDVANAVFEQSDAIMLSGETTVGKYPVKCVEILNRIAVRIEKSGGANFQSAAELTTARQKLVKSAVVMADSMKAEGLLIFTLHGNMARYAAWMRPHSTAIFAVVQTDELARQLMLNWGVYPVVMPFTQQDPEHKLGEAIAKLVERKHLKRGDHLVIVSSISAGDQHVDAIQMRQIN